MKRALLAWMLAASCAAHGAPPDIDRTELLADVRTLAGAAFEGRRAGTPGGARAQAYLAARMAALGLAPLGADFRQPFEIGPRLRGANLIGQIEGTDAPGRVLVLSAHFDHLGVQQGRLYPGADDDASGVAAVLQVARWLQTHRPRHTVLVALFDAEEVGLKGSAAFLDAFPHAHERIGINLNLDMIGRSDSQELYVVGTWRRTSIRRFVRAAAQDARLKVVFGHDWPDTGGDDWTDRTDGGSFAAAGLPFLSFGVEQHRDYHGSGDTFERIDPDFLTAAARLALRTVLELDRGLETIRP